jgi:hypothetical protein
LPTCYKKNFGVTEYPKSFSIVFRRTRETEVFTSKRWTLTEAHWKEETKRTTQREIFRQIESGELRFIETNTGVLLICGKSLEKKN